MTLLTPKEVAEKYGFSTSQIRRLLRQGAIKSHKIGHCYAIDERSVKSLKRQRSPAGEAKSTNGEES